MLRRSSGYFFKPMAIEMRGEDKLELSYVTKRVLVASIHGDHLFKRGNAPDIATYLEQTYSGHYKVYNFSVHGCKYEKACFNNMVLEFPLDEYPPPLLTIVQFVDSLSRWLDASPRNVAVVHCDSSRVRCAMMLCCWLLASGRCTTPLHAINFMEVVCNDDMGRFWKELSKPSVLRYLNYFSLLIADSVTSPHMDIRRASTPRKALLRIDMHGAPDMGLLGGCSPHFTIKRRKVRIGKDKDSNSKTLFYGKVLDVKRGDQVVEFDCCCTLLDGDICIEFCNGSFDGPSIFAYRFHTSFLQDDCLELRREDLDVAYLDQRGLKFPPNFKVVFWFSSVRPRGKASFETILDNMVYQDAFRAFLATQFAVENLDFLLKVSTVPTSSPPYLSLT
eukprot:TRINITY_DN9287_c0_g1_i1.p1 TRINITY_DN9287_c0_g1~~TRINITY_DN9287_c0_g1_i1.p1  ORF type:complete len:390 (-),score=67.57 TRINITY_DN9287_c0_g1_i1:28-1197(-)